ncbi:hypothetical protein [Geodermatophilus sabuli]|uniref:hypothetical protein n=1 Tax=Geodermatophilus sabuli TaxID=1564158 RepID=UPI001559BFF2|nr:hypothetical protein [Geodermatophilus sabuli]MBB3086922.1 hypothetical protein [Geodermatophilus sabuli]
MELVVGVLLVWALLAVVVAVVVGRGIRLADERSAVPASMSISDLAAGFAPDPSAVRR